MNRKSYLVGSAAVCMTILLTTWGVHHFHKPGHLDVITAQSMDMSEMRPPIGSATVSLAVVQEGQVGNSVDYTGSVAPYNQQVITPRVTGDVVNLPVYAGDTVKAGQLLVQLDSAEVGASALAASDNALQAEQAANVAVLTHHLHHQAALDQAAANREAASEAVVEAKADESAAEGAVVEARTLVVSADAAATYWGTELPREKRLADAGAVSQQDYQNELAQSQSATALVDQARAKVDEAEQQSISANAKFNVAQRVDAAADAAKRMAVADLTVAAAQVDQSMAGAASARDSAREAAIVQGYTTIVSPASGVVTERPVSPGTLVQPGTEILKIEQIDKVRIQANVAIEDLAGIVVGDSVTISTLDSEHPLLIDAKIDAIFPAADMETRTAVVEAVVANPRERLLPGEFVTMHVVEGKRKQGLLLPTPAVQSEDGVSSVWAVQGGNSGPAKLYECVLCHVRYSASQAANYGYRDPMDGGRLVQVKSDSTANYESLSVVQVPVTVVATDGAVTEVQSASIQPGSRIVVGGPNTLTNGEQVIDANGGGIQQQSIGLPAKESVPPTLYRCSKCGMAYSAADAKKNHYRDPMDGGTLVPVTGRT